MKFTWHKILFCALLLPSLAAATTFPEPQPDIVGEARDLKSGELVYLEHGQPMIFGTNARPGRSSMEDSVSARGCAIMRCAFMPPHCAGVSSFSARMRPR